MATERPIDMLLVGAGLMGRQHLDAAAGLESVRYVGIVDNAADRARDLAAPHGIPVFADLQNALSVLHLDAVDLCVPTPLHRPMIEVCAEGPAHVLCEKPLALTLEDASAILEASIQTDTRVMVAQVLRFWAEYEFVRGIAVEDRRYGNILSVDCKRLSPPPAWNSWMLDEKNSGGAVLDLQIHDMDFILQLLGKPEAVHATGRWHGGGYNAVFNRLIYPSGIPVFVEASLLMPESYPFRMWFKIEFEKATVEMDSWRPKGERLKIHPHFGEAFFPPLDLTDAYRKEIDYFARELRRGGNFARAPLEDSIAAVVMCLAARESCASGNPAPLREGGTGGPA